MDPDGNIYQDNEVPEEDKARLDGWLKAKAEEGELERMKAEYERQIREAQEKLGE